MTVIRQVCGAQHSRNTCTDRGAEPLADDEPCKVPIQLCALYQPARNSYVMQHAPDMQFTCPLLPGMHQIYSSHISSCQATRLCGDQVRLFLHGSSDEVTLTPILARVGPGTTMSPVPSGIRPCHRRCTRTRRSPFGGLLMCCCIPSSASSPCLLRTRHCSRGPPSQLPRPPVADLRDALPLSTTVPPPLCLHYCARL